MAFIIFDDTTRYAFLPFTHSRPMADIRCGILTMRERWEHYLAQPSSTLTEAYLQQVFPLHTTNENLYVNGKVFATPALATAIQAMGNETRLMYKGCVLAAKTTNNNISFETIGTAFNTLTEQEFEGEVYMLNNIWDIFSQNERAIKEDYQLLTKGRQSAPIPADVTVRGKENVFVEDGAIIEAGVIINATTGYVYIGKDATILEGCMIRGALALCEHAVLKMGTKVYGATTIGVGCKVGGEISNVVFFANSNKGHDGYLGNSVIGEWCNLGADTNCSNLKNNYDEIKIWSEHKGALVKTGLQFCGLMMGDHSKCGINTMFNTGTVVGVSANIFGGGFPDKFIPSFGWGGSDSMTVYDFHRAMDTANRMMNRRGIQLSDAEIKMYQYIFQKTASQREDFK
jgi:UDP-N-acetylglucosamine diphosphorylase/glucosamine-1-phosphate N-acetyltransferase